MPVLTIKAPAIITPRLMPGVKIGDGIISIAPDRVTDDNRMQFCYYLDTPDIHFSACDLRSGVGGKRACGGANLQAGLVSLLCFMQSAGEEYRRNRKPIDPPMFPKKVSAWCYQYQEELLDMELTLDETPGLIVLEI